MKNGLLAAAFLIIAFFIIRNNVNIVQRTDKGAPQKAECIEIQGTINKGETLFDIFKKYQLDIGELFKLREASADVHRLRKLYPGRPYKISVDMNNNVDSFIYWIDDDYMLNIKRTESGFSAEKVAVGYEKKIQHLGGAIKNNLIASVGEGRENLMLALQLSDIFAWDIDFTTDLRDGDIFKIVVEGFYLNGELKKYGEILSAEFTNNGNIYSAYQFEQDGKTNYYDADGKSLKKTFLKAPLSFRRISSGFSRKRYHPILRIYRPHHGLDYSAPTGTPVSAIGDGTVTFAGYKGQYGKLIILSHRNGWKSYYGHLSKISKGIKKGRKVEQGQIIGCVGTTGLTTGPHLHYEMRIGNKPVNPLTIKLPKGDPLTQKAMADFKNFKENMNSRLASIKIPALVLAEKNKDNDKL